jgi:hypothetical protein
MKLKDIYMIIIIGIFSMVVSIVLSNTFISSDKNRDETVEVIPAITSELTRPSQEYFNTNSINPTKTIQIGGEVSPTPFGSQ